MIGIYRSWKAALWFLALALALATFIAFGPGQDMPWWGKIAVYVGALYVWGTKP